MVKFTKKNENKNYLDPFNIPLVLKNFISGKKWGKNLTSEKNYWTFLHEGVFNSFFKVEKSGYEDLDQQQGNGQTSSRSGSLLFNVSSSIKNSTSTCVNIEI